jgi:uncharacterized membrane protein
MSMPAASSDTSGFLAAGITLSVFTTGIVTVRLAANLHQTGKLQADDYLTIIALVFLAGNFGVFYELYKSEGEGFAQLDPRPVIRRVAQYAEAGIFLSGFSLWTAKLPVLMLLARIFGIYRGVRISSIITAIVLGMAVIGADIYNAVICWPPSVDDDLTVFLGYVSKCTEASSLTGVILAPIGLAADVIIFILPIPIILKLQLSMDKKIGLAVVFLFGLVAIAGTAVSMKFKIDSRSGHATDVQVAMILTLLETTIVIAAGCVPAVKAFWAGFIIGSGWYSRLTSLLSTSGRNTSRGTERPTKQSQDTLQMDGSSTENFNDYYHLEEQQSVGKWPHAVAHPYHVGAPGGQPPLH